MKTLIAYTTKSGATRIYAEILADMTTNCTICDVSKQMPQLDEYDVVILGSGVRMGKIYKPMKKFIERNLSVISTKKIAIFLCNGEPNTFQQALQKNLPRKLLGIALCVESFRGIAPFSKPKNQDWISQQSVERLVRVVTL